MIFNESNHLNVELFLSIGESGFEDYKEVAVEIGFEVDSLCKSWHFPSCQVDSSLDFARAITQLEHARVVLSLTFLQSGHNRYRVELLSIKGRVVFQLVIDLVDGQGDDCFVVHRLVLFL